MINIIFRLGFAFAANLGALWIANHYISGFQIVPGLNNFFVVAGILTFLNIFIKPILKLILSPVIVLTLGFAVFLINALMLYLLDRFLVNITITDTTSLVYATIIISLVNLIISFSVKRLFKS
jgi:putative membrane protein